MWSRGHTYMHVTRDGGLCLKEGGSYLTPCLAALFQET
ncbi:hypothetical protein X907_2429 [Glycocaulis alkaliphilus]|uniref:Uncharacterized protein n=1 Tax=Glycocaulis alkaliphilus TaxID=1434191 RepID=A0A3T0ECD3_9PROT|nr:hypothetical protein X907_2429 [Glycocaulis alkaliphilus]